MEITMASLLKIARERGASDLHVTVGLPPKCRVNGNLEDVIPHVLTPPETQALIMPLINDRQVAILKRDGEVDFSHAIPNLGRFRVNAFRQKGSFACVIRLINTVIPKPEQLGIPWSVLDLTKKKRGLVLVTGPTGSGKSTTLACLINLINENRKEHIITLEDPIEYLHQHKNSIVNQREIGFDTLSFANGLRAALREDPDIILVGEMRDNETIGAAITAAETGHLVFSTLHTIGAAATIDRIIDVFPPHQQPQIRVQLASVLLAVVSQQLMPTSDGKGRVAAYEVMHCTPAISSLIRDAKSHQIPSIIQTSKKMGMQTMDDAIFDLYQQLRIAPDVALEYAQEPDVLKKRLF
ncbi:MAG: type IV pilus twitching motility protein PilT [Lachnospiraceae bacterium]|jgi:twitching motility protein PilT|nr:type IV pilus twitching motility protein PilT [Lachnospiraceae bacterium]MEE3460763.1 type IV pilus twitching motility protein PilT [Lachnospiraceae bacterium]